MTALISTLVERKEDFDSHLALAKALEVHLFDGESMPVGETVLTARHLLTIKSGLVIHLYNIVEAIMTLTINQIGSQVKTASPNEWTEDTLKEWLRTYASIGIEGNEDSRLDIVHKAAFQLLNKESIQDIKFKKPSGTWSDKVIYQFSQRLKVDFRLEPDMHRKIAPDVKYGDKTPLEFLADRRNAIAHGRRNFEDGARDLTLVQISELADVTIEYMTRAVEAFQNFIDEKKYMVPVT
ncbi:MAE_28990/MAE_18760 family HEPN-like nuclease [Teredinibacter turnerae]|uniref:MAE_28990/MAE_18760 family HEPN-like nuclease n=1 Tax=Teredinibacter turnerae TaxID=2426 RepID=UPI00037BDFD2|nr:MAE_28990/MAE_18760 family HEPN-like nuclease [Teredinibacter turnerae]